VSRCGSRASERIPETPAERRLREREELAREGYEFYADEACEFAEATSKATAEALGDDGLAW
jgi:hypothetical protein